MLRALPYIHFTADDIPAWGCPACRNASLEVVQGSFLTHPSAFSLENRGEDWYDTEHESFVFTCMLQCSRRSCRESVAVSGIGWCEQEPDDYNQRLEYYTVYQARSFVPPLPVFSESTWCPDEISEQLKMVSALLPISGNAAVNAIRVTLEMMLDTQDIPRKTTGQNPQRIPLARRIVLNKERLGIHYEAFHALKDFGNHGSHTDGPIRRSDIQGACLVLDDLIRRLYGQETDFKGIVDRLAIRYGKKPKNTQ